MNSGDTARWPKSGGSFQEQINLVLIVWVQLLQLLQVLIVEVSETGRSGWILTGSRKRSSARCKGTRAATWGEGKHAGGETEGDKSKNSYTSLLIFKTLQYHQVSKPTQYIVLCQLRLCVLVPITVQAYILSSGRVRPLFNKNRVYPHFSAHHYQSPKNLCLAKATLKQF